MVDQRILTQFDHSALLALQVMIALFTTCAIILSFLFAVAITALVMLFAVSRRTLVYVLSRRETRATFAAIGGAL